MTTPTFGRCSALITLLLIVVIGVAARPSTARLGTYVMFIVAEDSLTDIPEAFRVTSTASGK